MIWETSPNWNQLAAYVDLARRATASHPTVTANWEGLGSQLVHFERYDEAIEVLSEAMAAAPAAPSLQLILADAYQQSGRAEAALGILQSMPEIPAEDRSMRLYRLELLLGALAPDAAMAMAMEALDLDPANLRALSFVANAMRKQGRPEAAIPVCHAALKHRPYDTGARYELAVALTLSGHREEARRLIDIARFTTVTQVATPEIFSNAEAFEAALAAEIRSDPTLKPDPPGKATIGGLQTRGVLPRTKSGAISALLDQIRGAVELSLPDAADDPFAESRPERAELNAWAVIYGSGGRQASHIHSSGWLSGVYYVSAPAPSASAPQAGCLELGALELSDSRVDAPWGVTEIPAIAGRLVLFPSYIPHATVPTSSPDTRISVSFDVIPIRHRGPEHR